MFIVKKIGGGAIYYKSSYKLEVGRCIFNNVSSAIMGPLTFVHSLIFFLLLLDVLFIQHLQTKSQSMNATLKTQTAVFSQSKGYSQTNQFSNSNYFALNEFSPSLLCTVYAFTRNI